MNEIRPPDLTGTAPSRPAASKWLDQRFPLTSPVHEGAPVRAARQGGQLAAVVDGCDEIVRRRPLMSEGGDGQRGTCQVRFGTEAVEKQRFEVRGALSHQPTERAVGVQLGPLGGEEVGQHAVCTANQVRLN